MVICEMQGTLIVQKSGKDCYLDQNIFTVSFKIKAFAIKGGVMPISINRTGLQARFLRAVPFSVSTCAT